VMVERETPRSTFFAVTTAESTNPPDASRTVPVNTAELWPKATELNAHNAITVRVMFTLQCNL
jgi:hypothetical protein